MTRKRNARLLYEAAADFMPPRALYGLELMGPLLLILLAGVWGYVLGIRMAFRTRGMAPNDYPYWRKLAKTAWFVLAIGWMLIAATDELVPIVGNTMSMTLTAISVISHLTILAPPILWIVAWIKSRQVVPPTNGTAGVPVIQEEGVWPPAPRTDSGGE